MAAAITYIISTAFVGFVGWRLLELLVAGVTQRRLLWARRNAVGRVGPLVFVLLLFLWLALLLFCVLILVLMSYGYWTGRWAVAS